jgi:thioredoxin reductase (NADPH)
MQEHTQRSVPTIESGASNTSAHASTPKRPVLSHEQWRRLCTYGVPQSVEPGAWLFRAGESTCDMLLVESGAIEILRARTADSAEAVLAHYGPGQFSGEVNLLTGQATTMDARAAEVGTVYRICPADFRRLMESESDLSDLILRALVARRHDMRDGQAAHSIEVIAGPASSATLALRTYLDRQQLPHAWTDYGSDMGAVMAQAAGITPADLPAVLTAAVVIRRATPSRLADVLGLSHRSVGGATLDIVVVGGGPAGLAAAVNAASEGLQTLLVDAVAAGGQAAASSRIENYLGFPSGLSGSNLTGRAVIQAHKFGARIATPARAAGLDTTLGQLRVLLDDSTAIDTRSIVLATGARYRALPLPRWSDFEGTGIYYAATELEARMCGSAPVAVVGGANSAGQAALFLAGRCGSVQLIVRGASLAAGMSAYLADRVLAHPAITVHTSTEVTAVDGDDGLRCITTSTAADGGLSKTRHDCYALFCFIGAAPATEWLTGIALDGHGFVLTDARLPEATLGADWKATGRRPMPFETNRPGILAAGDVRAGSIKRVAAAVGEGASAISSIHAVLSELHR